MFQPVNSRVSFPQVEEKVLDLWKKRDVFRRSVEARRGRPRFTLYEGPPTANGNPGIHHVLSRVFKDIIPRYKAMKGYYAPRIAGWDTHGLPVELEVEKKLGLSSKAQIEEYGVARFNAHCRESVFSYLKEWDAMTERIGFWVDLEHAYVTMKNDYIESVWWAIKQMWDKGLVYQGYRVTPHCPRCGTSLSSHEVALGYQDDVEDPSVYIKFKLTEESQRRLNLNKPAYFLAWTTTPWTLPGNTALAVAANAEYIVVEDNGQLLILADDTFFQSVEGSGRSVILVRTPAKSTTIEIEKYELVERLKGSKLVGIEYKPLYEVPIMKGFNDKSPYRIIKGDFVSMEDGTGIVHVAPAYGEIDFEVGEHEGLPLVHTVGLDGRVLDKIPTGHYPNVWKWLQEPYKKGETRSASGYAIGSPDLTLPGAGKFVKEADKHILADLQSRNLLFRSEKVRHTYPFCWRCSTPLLYYAKQTWYIRTTAKKDNLIEGNKQLNWYPEHIKYGRFGDWLQNNVDWAFSRERYWGTPLPVWRCQSCGSYECIGSVAELKGKAGFTGVKEPLDLHRPFVDDITFDCKCGGKMQRQTEVIDCWFDSGAMPIAQSHYPFENETLLTDGRFPADYICEAVDQTRGWFYSLHAISTLLFDRPSFKNVICLGHILDAKGEKMSKAKRNVIEPKAMLDKYGADALRWYFYTSSPPGNVRRFSEKLVLEVTRRFLLTLWNVYSFFVTYANIDNFIPVAQQAPPAQSELDRWIISELHQLVADVDKALENYDPTEAGRQLEVFVDGLSNWYVRRSRRRFWKSESDSDKLAAYNTLYECLVTLAKLMAPFTPFIAEEMYQNLVCSVFKEAVDSVHLADFPVADASKVDKQLSDKIRVAMKISSLGRAARSEKGIKVRQPLAVGYVIKSPEIEQALKSKAIKQSVLDELNIKDIKLATAEELADLAKNPDYVVDNVSTPSSAICTIISPELAAESLSREVVHRLQTMRRSAGFEIADYINTYYQGDDYVRQVMSEGDTAEYIKQETLSRELIEGIPAEGTYTESYKLDGHQVTLGVRKLE